MNVRNLRGYAQMKANIYGVVLSLLSQRNKR